MALVGETGAGKSTIVKLVARFYDPTAGRVLVDGMPVTDLDLRAYRRQLGYVPQEAFLFSGTIRDNIAYGRPDATDAEVEAAAARPSAPTTSSPACRGGYLHPVTERGRSLSAGQRQLIALARAQLVDPAILLLDEATSNLDLGTEARVQRAMGVVAQRAHDDPHRPPAARPRAAPTASSWSTTAGSSRTGSHDELLALDGRYAELWSAFSVEPTAA